MAHNNTKPYMGFLGFLLKRMSNTVMPRRCALAHGGGNIGLCAGPFISGPVRAKLPKTAAKALKNVGHRHQKRAGLNLSGLRYWYTHHTNKRAHARVVSNLLILSCDLKITSF
jgi:hypothetical protein